ncbi:MAG: DUF1579 family protein [Bryobacteraceae bacterium]|nr:DUF1579 family protein [Bryobacteraceae bacterium]
MRFSLACLAAAALLLTPVLLTAQSRPDAGAQKAAMQKLRSLAGTWTGEAVVTMPGGKELTIRQTEEVQVKLDGLLLLVEGTGRDDSGKVVFNALAVISYDPPTGAYRFRAWNSGNTLETELKLNGTGFDWSYQQGPASIVSRMVIDDQGRWVETSETVVNGQTLHKTRLTVTRKP